VSANPERQAHATMLPFLGAAAADPLVALDPLAVVGLSAVVDPSVEGDHEEEDVVSPRS
jgi:hypothetical protein